VSVTDRKPVVLVSDDEPHIRAIVTAKLRSAGFTVYEAGDGQEALALARELTPDLLITDLHMPYMSGVELCTALKADPATSDIPAMLLTAHGFLVGGDELSRTNIRSVRSKPFSVRDVLQDAQRLLQAA
jgi:CheY-like chemotaxis protein